MMLSSTRSAPDFLKLLAHDARWHLLAALAESDRRVQELVDLLQRPQNLVSYHLRLLREHHLVTERRSSADGRDVYYSLDLDHLLTLYLEGGRALHPALADARPATLEQQPAARERKGEKRERPYRVLFLCTHNSARSQLGEGILRARSGHDIQVHSAGTEPGDVHPLAIRAAADMNIDISDQRSKHMDEFAGHSFDTVISVCDKVREACPVFPDHPRQIHWSLPDPAAVAGPEDVRYQAFRRTARTLDTRIGYLLLMIEQSANLKGREVIG